MKKDFKFGDSFKYDDYSVTVNEYSLVYAVGHMRTHVTCFVEFDKLRLGESPLVNLRISITAKHGSKIIFDCYPPDDFKYVFDSIARVRLISTLPHLFELTEQTEK